MNYLLYVLLLSSAWATSSPQRIEIHVKPAEEATVAAPESDEVKTEPLTDNEVEAVGAAVSAALRTVLSSGEKSSSVRGRCTYRGGFCPGALVELKNSKGQLVASQSLVSTDGFVFSNLKPGRYVIEVSYSRYKLKPVSKNITPGSEVDVVMVD